MSVIKGTDIDISKLTFSDVKVDNHGRKMIFVNYNGGKLVIQTPKMYAPNGVKRWRKKEAVDNKDDSFEIELSFGGTDDAINKFHEKMQEMDTLIKEQIMSHSKEWLGKPKISLELVENAFYSPIVKVPTDKEGNILDYPSRIKTKLDREKIGDDFTGNFLAYKKPPAPLLLFDSKKQPIHMTEDNFEVVFPKGSQLVGVLELVYLTITTKISAKWKLVQGKVYNNNKNITSYAMIDSDTEGDNEAEGGDAEVEGEEVEGTEGGEGDTDTGGNFLEELENLAIENPPQVEIVPVKKGRGKKAAVAA